MCVCVCVCVYLCVHVCIYLNERCRKQKKGTVTFYYKNQHTTGHHPDQRTGVRLAWEATSASAAAVAIWVPGFRGTQEISLNRLEGAPENQTASEKGGSAEPLRQYPLQAADSRPPSGAEDRCPPGSGGGLSLRSSGRHLGSRTPWSLGI